MTTTCSKCGVELAQSDVLYTTDGAAICATCQGQVDLVDTDKRAAANIVKAGWGAVGAGLLAFFGQMAMIGVIAYFFIAAAIISGVYALNSLGTNNERFTKHLTDVQRLTITVCAIAGFILSGLTFLGVPMRLLYGL